MEHFAQLQYELALKQAIGRQLDGLVKQANHTVLLLKENPQRLSKDQLKENQLRNAINVAGNVETVEVLLNFIRYQIARGEAWRAKASDAAKETKDFGHQVIADIQHEVSAAAQRAAEDVRKTLREVPDEQHLLNDAYCRLAEQYLGYLNRAFYYCEKVENGYQKFAAMTQEAANVRKQ